MRGHAAGGDHDRLDQCRGTLLLPEHTGHQIGQRFADADPGLTEQNFFVEQGIQHGVAEGNLPLAHGHAVGGQQIAENMFRLPVRPLSWFIFASFPVDDKLIRRNAESTLRRTDLASTVWLILPRSICRPPPSAGNTTGGLLTNSRSPALPRSNIATKARPPRLMCGATGVSL